MFLRKSRWSLIGFPKLKAFLSASVWLKTVLMAGRPMRSAGLSSMLVVAQTPILFGPSWELGTSRTMDITLKPAKKLVPIPPGQKARPFLGEQIEEERVVKQTRTQAAAPFD